MSKDQDSLLGMLSSKSRQPQAPKPQSSPDPTTSADTLPVVTNNVPVTTESSDSLLVRTAKDSQQGTKSEAHGASKQGGTISQLANSIMKEARRELGRKESDFFGDEITEQNIADAVEKVCRQKNIQIDDLTRAEIIIALKQDMAGWGVLQPLIDDPEVTDIHVYDYQTVCLQKGKRTETTAYRWATHEAYTAFVDRVLFKLGKSLTTAQHTVDASFPDGKRICAVHQTVCGARGPFFTMRVPRIADAKLENIVAFGVAPPLIVNYLAALVRACEFTFMFSGETGTGKTTLIRCLGTQFRPEESVVAVEDTPELNFQHPYFRSLVSRSANAEGVGEVTLQEHIKTTLRMCPSRVILGEMRSPEAAEAFLESAQTGHCGMSTIHARNAKETLTRLESLLGRAQRGVSMDIIRQQIALAIDVVGWLVREKGTGKIRLAEVIEVGHFVEGQIQVRPLFRLVEQGEKPVWEVQSWSSNYEEVLERNGILLGEAPQYLTLSGAAPNKR